MRRPLFWILVAAVALRLLYSFVWVRGAQGILPTEEITDGYDRIAENLRAGLGYRQFPNHPPTLLRPPGYPAFLYLVLSASGGSYAVVQAAQALLGAASCALLFLLGRWVLHERLGLWAAALGAIHPSAVQYSAQLYAENLYIPLFLALAWALCRAVSASSPRAGLVSGALFGLGILTRGTLLVFPPFLLAGLALVPRARAAARRWWRWLLPAAAGAIVVLSPWVARNYRLTGAFVPSSAWGWGPFYHGIQCSKAMLPWGDLEHIDRASDRARHEIVVARLYGGDRTRAYASAREYLRHEEVARSLVLGEIRRDPAGFALRGLAGIPFGWFQTLSPRKRIVSLAVHLPLMALFVLGAVRLARAQPGAMARAWPALCLVAFVTLFQAWVFPLARYLAPAVALSFLFSACACVAFERKGGACG